MDFRGRDTTSKGFEGKRIAALVKFLALGYTAGAMDDANNLAEPEVIKKGPNDEYTAFQMWEYKRIIYRTGEHHVWRNMAASYFFACMALMKEFASGKLREDTEGTATIFLFRHYLEVALKQIVFMARVLKVENDNLENAVQTEAPKVAKIHRLSTLWNWVLTEARPQLEQWDNYDTDSVGKCVKEFDAIDPGGVAFRYAGEGGEFCRYDFDALNSQMAHIWEVLNGIFTCFEQMREDIREYDAYLMHEFGDDRIA